MTLSQILYNIIDSSTKIVVSEIYSGLAPTGTSAKEGLITFFPPPSVGMDFASTTKNTQYQIDVYHGDMYEAETIKNQCIAELHGSAGIIDNKSIIISVISDNGGLWEDASELWHYSIIINIRYNIDLS